MKLLYKLLTLSFLLFTIVSCDKDYDMPPLNEPTYSGQAANITIAQLKEKYKSATQNQPATITENLILKAVISGDDESGNIYKQIYIQDETGGMSFQVDTNSIYTNYRQGQTVYINLKGLCISVYGGEQQLGDPNGYLYRTPYTTFTEHVIKDGWPTEQNISVKDFTDISKLDENAAANAFTVIRLIGVHFTNGGKDVFAPESGYGTQELKDAQGNAINIRTSNYADFASNMLPSGTGNVIAILGRFNGEWQLTIRKADDIFGFDNQEPGGGNQPTPEDESLFSETFKSNQGQFTIDNKDIGSLSYVWKFDSYNNSGYMKASAFANSTNVAAESWLVSPVIDLTSAKSATLTFEHTGKYFGTMSDEATLYAKAEGETSWKQLTIPNYFSNSDWNFVNSGEISLFSYVGKKMQFAFKYKSTSSHAGTWEIMNVSIKGTK